MDIESARRQFPSSVHHPLKKSAGQTDAESDRDIPHEVTPPPLGALSPTNGTRIGVTQHGRTSTARWYPTRRNIYIRGHLLSHLDTRKINSHSLGRGGVVIHRPLQADNVRKEGVPERSIDEEDRKFNEDGRFNFFSSVGRRHFMAQGQQLHNYKFLRATPTQVSIIHRICCHIGYSHRMLISF